MPAYQFVGAATPEYPWIFAGYRKLAGTPAIECPSQVIDLPDLAPRLGRILSALHGCAPEPVAWLGIVRLEDYREELERVRAAVPHDVFERCGDFVARDDLAAAKEPPRCCLLHGDLGAEHLLIDATGRLA